MFSGDESIFLKSVGIDVGSSTSHLIFSQLELVQDQNTHSRRYIVKTRNILYEGRIIDTPLIDYKTIDIPKLTDFIRDEFKAAGITPEEIDSGAVIITGETAKKVNAATIVESLAKNTGKFVSATAGPNFESMLAAMGSGITNQSELTGKTILSVDIGGGTSNMAISRNGNVISTACVSVGGRLMAINNGSIVRLDDPVKRVMDHLNLNYEVGDRISSDSIRKICSQLADILIETITGNPISNLAKSLMVTDDLQYLSEIDNIAFSGGIGELIYDQNRHEKNYDDIGEILADELHKKVSAMKVPVIEPENKIRATVIGAGAYSLSISGSTCYLAEQIDLPLRNIPVVRVDIDRSNLSIDHVNQQISSALRRFDITEGDQPIAYFFHDPVRASYKRLKLFAKAIKSSLTNSINRKLPIILVFERDIANSVGNVIKRETDIDLIMTLDELKLSEGDWIDIGDPLVHGQVFPVTVKSLVFSNGKLK